MVWVKESALGGHGSTDPRGDWTDEVKGSSVQE